MAVPVTRSAKSAIFIFHFSISNFQFLLSFSSALVVLSATFVAIAKIRARIRGVHRFSLIPAANLVENLSHITTHFERAGVVFVRVLMNRDRRCRAATSTQPSGGPHRTGIVFEDVTT